MDTLFGLIGNRPVETTAADRAVVRVAAALPIARPAVFSCSDGFVAASRKKTHAFAPRPALFHGADDDVVVACVGDLLNFAPLAEELRRDDGNLPLPGSEAELVYRLHRRLGLDALALLEGSTQVAIWERSRARLTLVADRLNLRPFFCHFDGACLVFGSHLKTLFAHGLLAAELDTEGLDEMATFGVPLPPDTMLRGVQTVHGGHLLVHERAPRIRAYVRRDFTPSDQPDAALIEQCFETFRTAVLERHDPGLQPGVLLSGGIDSGSIVAILHRDRSAPRLRTYCLIGAPDRIDRTMARRLARRFRTDHREQLGMPDRWEDLLPAAVWYLEAPAAAGGTLAQLCLSRMIHADTDVVFTGDGCDPTWGVFGPFGDREPSPPATRLAADYRRLRSLTRTIPVEQLFPACAAQRERTLAKIAACSANTGILYNDLASIDGAIFSQVMLCRTIGRLALDAGTPRFRFPFYDSRLMRLIDSLPPRLRMGSHRPWWAAFRRRPLTKRAFRLVLRRHRILPAAALRQPKTWLRAPMASALRGRLRPRLERVLTGPDHPLRAYLDLPVLNRLLDEHQRGRTNHEALLTFLLTMGLWQKIFLDTSPLERPPTQLDACLP
ncbi:MAG: hypothetical protein JXQ29_17555 [Planctomycetes bacterium]|nr:hypothetical protein [Planctomycetota bacterium]